VQHGGDHRGLGFHPHHHSERVQYVGRSALVTLAHVRLRRNQDRSIKGCHNSPGFYTRHNLNVSLNLSHLSRPATAKEQDG
jgi:hypothetical protein